MSAEDDLLALMLRARKKLLAPPRRAVWPISRTWYEYIKQRWPGMIDSHGFVKLESITEALRNMDKLKDVLDVQIADGNWNYDQYQMGMANGLILADHIMNNREGEPVFKTKPEGGFIGERSYREEVLRNCPAFDTDTIKNKLGLAGLGVAGEGSEVLDVMLLAAGVSARAGTVADTIKKVLYHEVNVVTIREKLIKEMGDVYWYLEYLAATIGVTRDEVLDANVKKLRARHPNGWTPASQQAKIDEKAAA